MLWLVKSSFSTTSYTLSLCSSMRPPGAAVLQQHLLCISFTRSSSYSSSSSSPDVPSVVSHSFSSFLCLSSILSHLNSVFLQVSATYLIGSVEPPGAGCSHHTVAPALSQMSTLQPHTANTWAQTPNTNVKI